MAGDAAVLGEPTDAALEVGCQGTMRLEVTSGAAPTPPARGWAATRCTGPGRLLAALDDYDEPAPVIDGCQYREALQAVFVEGGVAGNVVPDGRS